jgi:glycosyltransferase involved in cell wall biosynthesis
MASAANGVSVVIPTHNRPDLMVVTLRAVLNQRDVDFEVIVVDDGSDIPVVVPQDFRVRVVRHASSRGVAAARNRGIEVASKRWLAFTDDDDIWAPDKLHSQLVALAGTPGARWSAGGAVQVDHDLNIFDSNRPPATGDVAAQLLRSNPIPGGASGVVADADLVRRLGGFDERLSMCADYDLWIGLGLAAPMAAVHRPLLAYRVHEGGMSRSLENIRRELRIIEEKYTDERSARGVVVADEIQLWIGDRHQRSGRRIAAAHAYLRAASTVGRPRAAGRAVEALLWPGAFRLRDGRRRRAVPSAWVMEVEKWLGPIRDGDRAALRGAPRPAKA